VYIPRVAAVELDTKTPVSEFPTATDSSSISLNLQVGPTDLPNSIPNVVGAKP
jgi:hypothetical protein